MRVVEKRQVCYSIQFKQVCVEEEVVRRRTHGMRRDREIFVWTRDANGVLGFVTFERCNLKGNPVSFPSLNAKSPMMTSQRYVKRKSLIESSK